MAEKELWEALLEEVRDAAALDPKISQVSSEVDLLLKSGWLQDIAGKIDVAPLDSDTQVKVPGVDAAIRAPDGSVPSMPVEEPQWPTVEDMDEALRIFDDKGVLPSVRGFIQDLDELFAEADKLGVEV